MAEITIDTTALERQLRKDLGEIAKTAIPKAKKAALLRVSRSALSRWTRGAAKRAQVKAKLIRGRSSNKPYKDGRIISVNMASIPVAVMGPKGAVPRQTKAGVRVAGRHYPNAFVAASSKGRLQQTVFQREGSARGPLDEVRVEVKDAIQASAKPAVARAVEQRWEKEFEHNLKRDLDRIARKSRR